MIWFENNTAIMNADCEKLIDDFETIARCCLETRRKDDDESDQRLKIIIGLRWNDNLCNLNYSRSKVDRLAWVFVIKRKWLKKWKTPPGHRWRLRPQKKRNKQTQTTFVWAKDCCDSVWCTKTKIFREKIVRGSRNVRLTKRLKFGWKANRQESGTRVLCCNDDLMAIETSCECKALPVRYCCHGHGWRARPSRLM